MSAIDFILLGLAVLPIVFLATLHFYAKVSRPVTRGAAGGLTITDTRKHDAWMARMEKIEKSIRPTLQVIVAGASLAAWLIFRTVLSFV